MIRPVAVAVALLLCRANGITSFKGNVVAAVVSPLGERPWNTKQSELRAQGQKILEVHTAATAPRASLSSNGANAHKITVEHALLTREVTAKLVWVYVTAVFAMIAVVTFMFHEMGSTVVFQVVLYIMCLATVKIAMKEIFLFGFEFPKFITALHLALSSFSAFSVMLYRSRYLRKPFAVPTTQEAIRRIMPIALAFGLSISSENSALLLVSAGFSEVLAACAPVVTAFVTWTLGMPFNSMLLVPITYMVLGCVISVSGELYFSPFGFLLLCISTCFRSIKGSMQQLVLTGETKDKFDPVALMAWTCLFSCAYLVAYSLYDEGLGPVNALRLAENRQAIAMAIGISCIFACSLNICALYVTKQLSAVGCQMVGQMKGILVVIGGMALLSESFTTRQWVGFVMVLTGVYWYSRWLRILAASEVAAKATLDCLHVAKR